MTSNTATTPANVTMPVSPISLPVPIDKWLGWSEERETIDLDAGETVYYREHIKTRKREVLRREPYFD